MKAKQRSYIFSSPLTPAEQQMLKRVSEKEDIPMANLFRRWVRSEFERLFPGEKA